MVPHSWASSSTGRKGVAVAAEYGNQVAFFYAVNTGYIQHQLIHTHPADHRGALPMHQHFRLTGKGAGVAVGITDGHRGHAVRPWVV